MEVVELEMVYAYPGRRLVRTSGQTECQECISGNYKTINPRLLKVTFEGQNGSTRRITCARCGRKLHVGFFRRPA